MSRTRIAFAGIVLGLLLGPASRVQAGPTYTYNWSTLSASDIVINAQGNLPSYPPQYSLTVRNEQESLPLSDGTDTVASRLIINKLFPSTQADNISASFDLKLVIKDLSNGLDNSATPIIYHLTMDTSVSASGEGDGASVNTNAVTMTPLTPTSITLGNDTFWVTLPSVGSWFTPPPNFGAQNPGAIGLHINVEGDGGSGANPTPEPSTILLGCVGMSFAGLAAWRKRRASKV